MGRANAIGSAARGLIVAGSLALVAAPVLATPDVRFVATPRGLAPPPPAGGAQLVLDDNSVEGRVGVGDPAEQFLWFNQFAVAGAFQLDEIWVLFPAGEATPGNAIQLVVYTDTDGDPTNGATLVASFAETVQVADGSTFSVYPLATPLVVQGVSDVLIGVIPRWIVSGVTPATEPAAIDTTSSQMRSWIAIWSGDPPASPELPPDDFIGLIDGFIPGGGNWMIRGFGSPPPLLAIPTLGRAPLALLAAALAMAGGALLRRRRNPRSAP